MFTLTMALKVGRTLRVSKYVVFAMLNDTGRLKGLPNVKYQREKVAIERDDRFIVRKKLQEEQHVKYNTKQLGDLKHLVKGHTYPCTLLFAFLFAPKLG